MNRITVTLLEAGLVVSAIGAILFAVRIILGSVLPVTWYWGGAIGAFAGPVAFTLALRLYEGRVDFSSKKEAPK